MLRRQYAQKRERIKTREENKMPKATTAATAACRNDRNQVHHSFDSIAYKIKKT